MNDFDFLFKLMDDFITRELDRDLTADFERGLIEDECFCHFFNTFKKTVDLCRQMEAFELQAVPQTLHFQLIETLRVTPQAPAPKALPSQRARKKKNKK